MNIGPPASQDAAPPVPGHRLAGCCRGGSGRAGGRAGAAARAAADSHVRHRHRGRGVDLALGRVFVANMTGNVVFAGFAITGAPGFPSARPCSRWPFPGRRVPCGRMTAKVGHDRALHLRTAASASSPCWRPPDRRRSIPGCGGHPRDAAPGDGQGHVRHRHHRRARRLLAVAMGIQNAAPASSPCLTHHDSAHHDADRHRPGPAVRPPRSRHADRRFSWWPPCGGGVTGAELVLKPARSRRSPATSLLAIVAAAPPSRPITRRMAQGQRMSLFVRDDHYQPG